MGWREWTNRHPKITYSVVGACVLICVGAIVAQVMGGRKHYPSGLPDAYFSIDDGKTFFVANTSNYPPFASGSGTAVRAYVFQCGSGKKFVGFLERFSASSKKFLDAGNAVTPSILRFGREIKRPGDTVWEKTGDMVVESRVENITCPDGGTLVNLEP